MATSLRGSDNYVWDTLLPLGQGATSMVFMGRCKASFEVVAVKVFNNASFARPMNIQMREFEVMRKLNHVNIVKLLAVEEESLTGNKVMVMEYCQNGSLFSILEEPQHAFGLPEEEVLLVLQHVANGMKHLRDNAVVHRDVKPGNILRCKDERGRSVYKLTDFGAARELDDEENFTSLYGTEEYLHPGMYEKAVLRRSTNQSFDASVDLWSLGVTLYHMATGNLPFRPFGGRRDRELMFNIVSKKDTGVISGVQMIENGPIHWSRTLPDTCQLSNGLKQHLVPILASLLETKADKIWQFDDFFNAVDDVCNKTVINTFCPTMCKCIQIYINTTQSMTCLSDCVAEETGIKSENQLILFDNQQLHTTVNPLLMIQDYCAFITKDNPIFIFDTTATFQNYPDPLYIAPFPQLSEIPGNYRQDYMWARRCCRIAHSVLQAVRNIIHSNVLLHTAVKQYSNELQQDMEAQGIIYQHIKSLCQLTNNQFSHFIITVKLELSSLCALQQSCSSSHSLDVLLNKLKEMNSQAKLTLERSSNVIQEHLQKIDDSSQVEIVKWDFHEGSLPADRCCEYLQELITKLESSLKLLKENKLKRSLAHNDEQIHKYERSQIKGFTERIKNKLTTECCPMAHSLYQKFQTWYSNALTRREQCEVWKRNMGIIISEQKQLHHTFNDFSNSYITLLEDYLPYIQNECVTNSNSSNNSLSLRQQVAGDILKGLKTTRSSVEEMVQLVKENNTIIEKFENLSCDGPVV